MTILRPALENQTITVIPRYEVENATLILYNKQTNSINSIEVETTYSNGYLTFSFDLTCKEAESYDIELKDGEIVLFRGKAFATDETDLQNYKMSKGLIQ